MDQHEQPQDSYEAPVVEDLDVEQSPATVAPGVITGPV
jgi:hypothetical protein